MSLFINGGTDHAYWVDPNAGANAGTIAFWMKSTQTTLNVLPISHWSATSRSGWGVVLNNTGFVGKIVFAGYSSTASGLGVVSATTLNDGNWHHVAITYNRTSGQANTIYIDGVQDATANSTGAWGSNSTSFFIQAGDQLDAFWGSFLGNLSRIGFWNVQLTLDEIKALAAGVNPKMIRRASLLFSAPLAGMIHDNRDFTLNALVGATLSSDDPKFLGASV